MRRRRKSLADEIGRAAESVALNLSTRHQKLVTTVDVVVDGVVDVDLDGDGDVDLVDPR